MGSRVAYVIRCRGCSETIEHGHVRKGAGLGVKLALQMKVAQLRHGQERSACKSALVEAVHETDDDGRRRS